MMLMACDHISEDERLIYEKPEPAQRVVLIEDFTGQRCSNCPKATEVIEQLQETYGEAIVAVGIHGGPLGFAGNAKNIGLSTETGDAYYNHWGLEYQPIGLVNRHSPVNYPEWAAAVKEELAKPAPLRLDGIVTTEGDVMTILLWADGTDGNVTGKLQLWLLEDGITALQLMPDGTPNMTYVHNHVFRTAINGLWGEDFSVKEGETVERTFEQHLEPNWNKLELSVVAFVYNEGGVLQAVKIY